MGKPNITLGIEVGDSSLKLALHNHEIKRIERTSVIETTAHPLREVNTLEQTIKEWLEPYPDTSGVNVTLTLPARMGMVRLVDIPADIKDVREYVEWEYAHSVTADRKDTWLDYQVFPGRKKGEKLAVVAGVRKAWLQPLRKGFANKNLVPNVIELDAFSLINLLSTKVTNKKELVCAIKVDTTGVILAWGQKGVLCALRWVSVSALSTMGRLDAFDALSADITTELHKGFNQMGVSEAEGKVVYICGDLSIQDDFVDRLRQKSPDFLYSLIDAFPNLLLEPNLAPKETAPLCATAIGASLRYFGDGQ